jgi:hypothetical protein
MHCGKLTGNTAAARVFEALLHQLELHEAQAEPFEWLGGCELTMIARVTPRLGLPTRVHDVCVQLEAHPEMGYAVESEQRGRRWFYRLVRTEATQ